MKNQLTKILVDSFICFFPNVFLMKLQNYMRFKKKKNGMETRCIPFAIKNRVGKEDYTAHSLAPSWDQILSGYG